MNRQEQLRYIFNLDLDGSYTELQYKDFLLNYRTAYREVYAMFEGVKYESDCLKRELSKKQDELKLQNENVLRMSKEIFSLRVKLNSKLSLSERLFGKIKM